LTRTINIRCSNITDLQTPCKEPILALNYIKLMCWWSGLRLPSHQKAANLLIQSCTPPKPTNPPCWVESSISPSEAPNKRVAPRHSGGRALVAMVLEDAGGLGAYRKLIQPQGSTLQHHWG
jgi:hypothetical protein